MSDGNFNRALLPHTPYKSGLRAGKSMCRMHALDVLKQMLPNINPTLNEEQKKEIVTQFELQLSKKL